MKKNVCRLVAVCLFLLTLTACGAQRELADMESVIIDDYRCVVWEGRTYAPFCVVSKSDRGEQLGYVDGDKDDRISEYNGYSSEAWLVSWITTDGGAMLLKEETVTDIPDGLVREYL